MLEPHHEIENPKTLVNPDSPDVSSIEKDSFLEGYQRHGCPLHSTALEEDLIPGLEGVQDQETGQKRKESPIKKKPSQKKAKTCGRGRTKTSCADGLQSQKSPFGKPEIIESRHVVGSLEKKRRKSSSSPSSGSSAGKAQKRRVSRRHTSLEMILEAFTELCSQYRESVQSSTKAMDTLSSFQEQLTEKLMAAKKLSDLKKANAKVNALINRKRVKLLENNEELILSELELASRQKERTRLELQVADLRCSSAFLSDVRLVTNKYLEHQQKHGELEEHGSSSLPVLLLEAKNIIGAEDHLSDINFRLESL